MSFKQNYFRPLLLSLVIILSLVADLAFAFNGNQQAKSHDKFQKLKYLREQNDNIKISEIDKSLFEAKEIDLEAHVYDQEGLKEKDKIDRLPGQPLARFSQYGGYVTVDEKAGRAFYYYFTEAFSNKEKLPLVLWLNGGSIYYGYILICQLIHILDSLYSIYSSLICVL